MITVNYIPVREKLEYVVEQAERQKFSLPDENALSFMLYFRKGPHCKWLNTNGEGMEWLQFQTLRDSSGLELHISYNDLKLVDRRKKQTLYHLNLGWLNQADKRRWIVERVLEMVDNPSLYQEHVAKVASWQKYRKMKEQTYSDLLNGVLSKMNISTASIDYPQYKKGDYGDYKEVKISFTYEGMKFDFHFAEKDLHLFVEMHPSIAADALEVKQHKRGRLTTHASAQLTCVA